MNKGMEMGMEMGIPNNKGSNLNNNLNTNIESNITKKMNNCSICLEELTFGTITLEDCSHKFHLQCLKEWSNFGYECPCCRTPFQEQNIEPDRFSDYYDEAEFYDENLGGPITFTKDPNSPEFNIVSDVQVRDLLIDFLKEGDMVKVFYDNGISEIHLWENNNWSILDESESNEVLIGYLCDTYGEDIINTLSEKTLEIVLNDIEVV